MLKVIELFSGIGAQRKALENIGINHKVVAFCEIDKYAEKSYRAIFNDYETPNLGDITKLDTLPYADLVTWSFPCQDISQAGKQKGIIESDRSSLCWNVVYLLSKMENKPKYLLMENVDNLIGSNFINDFIRLQNKLSDLGYSNYYFTMNAKNYGIPQSRNRVFMISFINEKEREQFIKPKEIPLIKLTKDFLQPKEEITDYYLKNLNSALGLNHRFIIRNNESMNRDITPCILTKDPKSLRISTTNLIYEKDRYWSISLKEILQLLNLNKQKKCTQLSWEQSNGTRRMCFNNRKVLW